MLKIITWIISKKEFRLSKKNNCDFKNKTDNEEIKLYRKLLNDIDSYNYKTKKWTILRHYRYKPFTFKIDEAGDKE